jgi:hypothetical protein
MYCFYANKDRLAARHFAEGPNNPPSIIFSQPQWQYAREWTAKHVPLDK